MNVTTFESEDKARPLNCSGVDVSRERGKNVSISQCQSYTVCPPQCTYEVGHCGCIIYLCKKYDVVANVVVNIGICLKHP